MELESKQMMLIKSEKIDLNQNLVINYKHHFVLIKGIMHGEDRAFLITCPPSSTQKILLAIKKLTVVSL